MLAILTALPPTTPPRQLRLLLAIETFPADAGGWRSVGTELLMEAANVSYPTFKAARQEVLVAGWAEYKPGAGAGKLSRWRLLVDLKTWEDRVTTLEGRKGGNPPPAERDRSRVTDRVTDNAETGQARGKPANSPKAPGSAAKRPGRKATKAEITEFRKWASRQPSCPDGMPGGDLIGPDGVAPCPLCRQATSAESATTTWRMT